MQAKALAEMMTEPETLDGQQLFIHCRHCLYIAVEESVAKDVAKKVNAHIATLEAENTEMREALGKVGPLPPTVRQELNAEIDFLKGQVESVEVERDELQRKVSELEQRVSLCNHRVAREANKGDR